MYIFILHLITHMASTSYLNNLRALATIAVILLHVASSILYNFSPHPSTNWHIGNLYDSAVRFSVPIFFMLSGALLLDKDYSLTNFFHKRFLKVLPPFIFWCIVYACYNFYIQTDAEGKPFFPTLFSNFYHFYNDTLLGILHGNSYHLWFVFQIIGIYLVTPLLRPWVKQANTTDFIYFLILWLTTLLIQCSTSKEYIPDIPLATFTGYIGYFVLGYFLHKHVKINSWFALLLYIAGFAFTVLGTYFLSVKQGAFSGFYYEYLSFNVLLSAIGVFLFFKNLTIPASFSQKTIALIGENSYGIYLAHVLILNILERKNIDWQFTNPLLSIPLLTLLCLSVTTLLIHTLHKNKYLSYIAG
ncbi:MAG: acyltransferase family protein [Chitinophagales bacterium]